MGVFTEDVSLNVENVEESQIYAVFEPVEYTAILGESAAIQVPEAINYIKSGQAEINEVVQARTQEFNQNAADKTNSFNTNVTDKTNNFNLNATNKTEDFNQNASDKTGDFNSNASDKTGDFNLNATNKTNDFNDNYVEKKGLIDAEVSEAEAFSDLAKQWAIGEPTEPTGYSAKYWAGQAEAELSGLTNRVSTIEGKIPAEASSSNQLADKSYVGTVESGLQSQIDALVVSSDVFDVVGTYAELQAYDISTVPVNDIIKVLVDSTHSGAATYYRCVETGGVKSWSYIGSEGAYYTKAEADSLFATPSDIGNATITITQGGVSKGTFTTNQSGDATIDVDAATIPSNMVTTDTAQTITSEKTFLSQIVGTMHSYSATNSSVNTSPYKKIAECVLTGTYQTLTIPFIYSRTNVNVSESAYLGRVILRVSGTAGNVSSSESGVILADYPDGVRNGDIKFFILYKNNTPEANKATFQLWVYISGTYTGINVIPLRQGIGGSSYSTTNVTWGNNITEAAELPSDYTAIAQKFADYNPFGIWYGTSSSNADATEKVVILPVYTSTLSLNAGQCLIVKPTTTSTVADSTIKLVASDGTTVLNTAKTMKYNNANITTSTDSIVWNASYPSIFVYDGTYWVFLGHGIDSNTTYSAMSVSEGTTGTATSSRTMRADYLKQILDNRIQQVNSLPASPVSNILYCIPES